MADIKELKDEELKNVAGGGNIGNDICPDYVPEEGKIYRKKTNGITYARVTSVDKGNDIVFYDVGMLQYVHKLEVTTLNSSSDLIWDFFDEYEYCNSENLIWE